jgi:hypothetical protein
MTLLSFLVPDHLTWACAARPPREGAFQVTRVEIATPDRDIDARDGQARTRASSARADAGGTANTCWNRRMTLASFCPLLPGPGP